jgi:hypothetical protein
MKRREFLNLTMGSAVAAVVPLPAGAGSVAAKAPKNLYAWAVAMAHAGNPISEQTLGMALKVPADQATALMSRLVTRGVVHAPNAAGVARAVNPALRSSGFIHSAKAVSSQTANGTGKALKRAGDALSVPDETPDSSSVAPNDPHVAKTAARDVPCATPDDVCVPQEGADATHSTG